MTARSPLEHYLSLEYPFTVVPDDGSFFIEFPDLPGCMTQVEDAAQIAPMAEEIRRLWLETTYYDTDLPIPEPSTDDQYSGKFVTRVPRSLHRDLARAAKREGMSLNAYVLYLLSTRSAVADANAKPDDNQRAVTIEDQPSYHVAREGKSASTPEPTPDKIIQLVAA